MILFGSTFSPFVRKVAAYCAEKGLEYENVITRFDNPEPDFLAASPFRKIPALKDGDVMLADSSAIIHYLEAKHPEPALIPADPAMRGRTIFFEEVADTIVVACGAKIFFNRIVAPYFLGREGDLAAADTAERDELPPLLDKVEDLVPANGFLVGDSLTLADLALASPFANFRHLGLHIDPAKWPKLASFADRILARPSFSGLVAQEEQILQAFAPAA